MHSVLQPSHACLVQLEEVPARVSGSIPDWLEGSLIVNGGGDYTFMRHMFDGYAFVSKIRVGQGGQVWGAQRFIKTKAYDAFQKKGRYVRLTWHVMLQGQEL